MGLYAQWGHLGPCIGAVLADAPPYRLATISLQGSKTWE